MESNEMNGTAVRGIGEAPILFNDIEYDRKFRALQSYLPFIENLLQQSSGNIASNRLQSLQKMLKETDTKMKYDVMAKCESVLQSLSKKMEAAKCAKSTDLTTRASTVQTSAATQPVQPATLTSALMTKAQNVLEKSESRCTDQETALAVNEHKAKHPQVSRENSVSQTNEGSGQTPNEVQLADEHSQLDANPENRSMMLTLKLAAARTARNAETTLKPSKRVPITWDETSTVASKKSEIDTLKLAAARTARFAGPPQIPDPRRVTPKKDDPTEPKKSTANLKKSADISTLKLAAARNTKPADIPKTVPPVPVPDSERHNSFQMSRDKLKKFINPVQKAGGGEVDTSPPHFQGARFDMDSPRNDWDFQAAPESSSHWNPSPPVQNASGLMADAEGESLSNSAVPLKSPTDQIASSGIDDSKTPAGSVLASTSLGSYYSPIHGLVQRRISSGHDSPLSPDESASNTAEAKRRLRDKLSQEINMVHRVGTSKGGSLRGLAAKDGKVAPISSKETSLVQDKKAGQEILKKPEKVVEIEENCGKKELTTSSKNALPEPTKETPKVLKGLYAPRYKSSQVNSSAKSGIVSSEHKPASRSSVDASRLMKSPPSDPGLKKMSARTENKDSVPVQKLSDTNDADAAGAHSRILSTMTTEELKRAVHLNVRNLPSPPTISPLVLESVKVVPNRQPEKVILNPAFNNSPPPIEPGFFSESDVDLRLGDSNGYYPGQQDVGFQQRSAPQAVANRDPRATYVSRFDRETPMSPGENSNHHLGQEVEPMPRHVTYNFSDADSWQGNNSNSRWTQNDMVGNLPLNPLPEESFLGKHSQSREAQWMNGGHQQMPYSQQSSIGDFQGPHCDERLFHQSFRDQHAMQMPRGLERNSRMSGDRRDFRGPPFQARNIHELPQERGRDANQFPIGDGHNFQGTQFHGGSHHLTLNDRQLLQDPVRNMNNMQADGGHGFRGPQFPARNLHHAMLEPRGVLPRDPGRTINHPPNSRNMMGASYQGRNVYGSSFEGHEQQMSRNLGENVNQPFGRSHDYPGMLNQDQQSHLQINEFRDQNRTSAPMTALLHPVVPEVQGTARDPRNLRNPVRPEKMGNSKYQWSNPLLPTPSCRPARDLVPQTQVPPKPLSITTPSPTTVLEKSRPAVGPLSPLPSAAPQAVQMLPNPDCIPFKPPRILDPRMANRTAPPVKGVSDSAPSKDTSTNAQRKQRKSWTESTQKRNSKDHHARRGSWEAEEARRREERRKSEQSRSHRNHHDSDDTSTGKPTNKSDFVSPLNSLYGSPIIQKTGIGYGIQKFKIPKIRRPSPPRPVEPAIAASVKSPEPTAAESLSVPEPVVNLPAEEPPPEQKTEEVLEPPLKPIEQKPVEHQTENQNPVEPVPEKQPVVEKPQVEPNALAAPLFVEAFMQQGNVNVNQLLENLKLLGNLKPNQLKKFKNILMNSSSSDDSDADDSSVTKKKKGSKLKASRKKGNGGLNKSSEDAESMDSDALFIADNSPDKSVPETAEAKSSMLEEQESVEPTRTLRGRKPGPLSAKKKELESNSKALEPSNDLDSSTEPAPRAKITRTKRRNSLEILQADIKEMYISDGVLSASGRRICTMLKKEEALTAAAKALPKKHAESLADDDSDNQTTTSKKKTPPKSSKKGTVPRKTEKIIGPASRRSGRSLKHVARSDSSSEGEDALDEIESIVENVSESDDDKNESIHDKDNITAETVDSDSVYIKPKPRKRKPVKRRQNLKDLSTTATSSASEDDEETILPPKTQRKKNQKKVCKSREAISEVECESADSASKVLTNTDCDSSPIRKKKVSKSKPLDTSDSCIESVHSSVLTSTSTDNIDCSTERQASNVNVLPTSASTNPSVILEAYVRINKMDESSLTPSPSFCSSDELSDTVPLIALTGTMPRQVARRGRKGRTPRSRRSQPVSVREARVSSEYDSSLPSDGFPKPTTCGGTDDSYLVESISDIIDRLSKDDYEAKGDEGDNNVVEETSATKESVTRNQKKKRKSSWSLGVIKKKRPIKASSPESVGSESMTRKVDKSLNEENAESAPIVSVQELIETEDAVDLPPEISMTNQKVSEELATCNEEIPENKEKGPSLDDRDMLVASASSDTIDNEKLSEEQDNNTLHENSEESSSTESIRNVDKNYYISHNLKSRKYPCKLCSWSGTAIVSHYSLTHPEDETFISRLSEEAAEKSIAESRERGYVSAEDTEGNSEKPASKRRNQNYTCRICFFKCTNFVQFYDHCCGHTGEYRYKCTQCEALVGGKGNLFAHYQYHHKELKGAKDKHTEIFPSPPARADGAFGYICPLCNFVQMRKSNVVKHVLVHHPEESDSVEIVYINLHVDSDKKRIALRKRSKSVDDAAPEESCDADAKTKQQSGNINKESVEDDDQTLSIDLAAFLPTDQENASHPDKELVMEDSNVSCFASKLMPDDQNTLIDALLKRTENLGEGKSDSTPHQTNLLEHGGNLDNQMPSESLLADDMSQDSCVSDSTITDDLSLAKPAVGTSDLMDDIIQRLKQSTAQELSDDSDAIEPLAKVKIEDQHRPIFVGPFEVRRVGNLPIYGCEIDNCNFSAVSAESFISHLKYNHVTETWDGMCQTCCDLIIVEDVTKLLTAFLHLLKTHLSSLGVESEEAQLQVALHEGTLCRQDPLSVPHAQNSSEQTPVIRLRRFSGDTLSIQKDKIIENEDVNMCVIENVVSLAVNTPSLIINDIKHEPLPLPEIAKPLTRLSYLVENIDEQNRNENSSETAPIRSPPKIMRFTARPPPNFKVPKFPATVQSAVPKGRKIRKRKASHSDVDKTAGEQAARVQQQAMVQCAQAKEEKEPAAYERMLERPKLRHLFKCMARSCSYSCHNGADFGRHAAEHKVDKCERCSYCMKAFVADEKEELVAHIQLEHGHCTFQCAYCFYRAVCPSYVVVHQNFIHTNKSISVLQCLGTAEVERPVVPLADVVPSYICGQSDCGETFLLTEQFILHLHETHTQIHNYSCHLCDTVCFDSRNFITHYRVHSLYLYQCRYCVHGTSNDEVMHHHLCNFHPGLKPLVVVREANDVGVDKPVTVDDLKVVNLGDQNAVPDDLIVKVSMDEMVEDVEDGRLMILEPEAAMVIDTNDEAGKTAAPVEEERPTESTLTDQNQPPAEPICVIDLDSDDEVNVVDLASSSDERSVRPLRSSPRKPPVEGEAIERRPRTDKRTAGTKEEGTAKPRATTTYEFGAITLEDLQFTGFSGKDLFKCAFSACDMGCETMEELQEHLMVCDHSRNSHGLECWHCKRPMKTLTIFFEHIRSHGTCRYGCGLCVFRATGIKPVQAHLRARHRVLSGTKIVPLNKHKSDHDHDLFVIGPIRPDKRKNHLVSQLQSPDKKGRPKYVYQPDEGHLLPIGAIYPFIVTCATCSFTTKVRKNMERHLVLHKSDISVPSQNPVNAVPCLETKEMMFDKMTNLAASSNLKAPDSTNLYLTPEDVARLPKFVPEQQRYRCGTQNCTYNSCDENMLIHHLRALHRDEDYYNCPHCPPASENDPDGEQVSKIVIDKLSLHLKMHDNRLYKCGYCFYYDHRRHIVERHVTDKHSDYKMHFNVVREPFSDGSPVVSSKAAEKEVAKEPTPRFAWKCARCEFESVTRPEMVNHSDVEHGKKLQYECGICHNRFQSKQTFDQHCGFKHPGLKEQLLFNFFKQVENTAPAAVEPAFDTRPLWSRDGACVKHIRGILFDDDPDVPPKDVPEPEQAVPPPAEQPPIKEAMFLCSICKVFETAVKADMKIHLYKELKYFRYQCTVCDKKVFSLTAGQKHMSRAHASTEASTALTLFERDLETEQKVEEILAAQEDLMQLDSSKPARPPARSYKAKAPRAKHIPAALGKDPEAPATRVPSGRAVEVPEIPAKAPEVEPSDAASNGNESDVSINVDDSDGEQPQAALLLASGRQKSRLPKTLECKECGQLFRSVRGLKVHIRLSHLKRGKWMCNTCHLTHTNRVFVETHAKSAHPGAAADPPVGVNLAWSANTSQLTDRYWRETWGIGGKTTTRETPPTDGDSADRNKCRHCGVGFPKASQRNRHETNCDRKPFRCGHCGFGGDESDVCRHSELAHPKLPVLIEATEDQANATTPPNVESRPDGRRRKQTLQSRASFEEASPAKRPRNDAGSDSPEQHFGCFYCPMRARARPLVHSHWLREHKELRLTDDGDFHANTGVSFQLRTINGPLGAFPCAECGATFDAKAALEDHDAAVHSVGGARYLDEPFEADSSMLDQSPSLWPLEQTRGADKNVARKSTTKVPRAGFLARKSTGNSPKKHRPSVSPSKVVWPKMDSGNLSISAFFGSKVVTMQFETFASFHDVNPRVALVDCRLDPQFEEYFDS